MQLFCSFWDHSRCPRCQQADETTKHVLICPDDSAGLEWRCRVASIGIWLSEVDTLPSIWQCILDSLTPNSTDTLFTTYANPTCLTAATEQDKIGW
jgi:hypothetical protein